QWSDRRIPAPLRERAGEVLLQSLRRGRPAGMTVQTDRGVKPPPEKPEAEASLLGAMLMDGALYNEVARGRLGPADLSREQHRIVLAAIARDAEQIDARGDMRLGIRTGIESVDKKTGGLQASDLILIAGRPGLGKTSLALNVVEHAAVVQRKTCAFFSMEMSEMQVVQRLVSMLAEINGNRMRRGRLPTQEITATSAGSSELQQAPIFVEESSRPTVTAIHAKSRRL